ncbi:ABC transporter substrate-binding protein [Paenirhodobacter sp.]|uniref:ABC transporter substrate-binding protein n=1 Tax=Paenirhodobacter sp. TaxID=1965326 RepID=UPI003B3C958D
MSDTSPKTITSRRRLLALSATALGAGVLGGFRFAPAIAQTSALAKPTPIKIAWSQTAVCHSPLSVAFERGFFEQYNLQVEPISFSGSTDQFLQAIATGHADGGIGMALRWLRPLEQGFDVGLAVGTHGGCMRLLTNDASGVKALTDLKGRKVAVSDQASPIRNFFAIRLAEAGINPDSEVEWVQYPADLFGEALAKGEVAAIAGDDPHAWLQREKDGLLEIGTNLDDEYLNTTCCVLGLRGELIREQPDVAAAITRAVVEAQAWTAANPDESARIFAPHIPAGIPAETVSAILREHTHNHHSTGAALRSDVELWLGKLQGIGVIRPGTNLQAFAAKVVPDVLI